ncbi:hypothetical protein BOTNAR_0273g00130 [Botryotinia narcissicola]|uniref:Uncharacterized protein n=1 Tax=Botryotinia narcissicola TaxID=278944 RepID=A0A4Z1I651_9HELO|nr:hypothetical protein BOTNAR_0273g00130 [Botryotinia narcissicola]
MEELKIMINIRSKLINDSTPATLDSLKADISKESKNKAKASPTTCSELTAHTKGKKKDRGHIRESVCFEVYPKLKGTFFKRKAATTTDRSNQSNSDSDKLVYLRERSSRKMAFMISAMNVGASLPNLEWKTDTGASNN